MAGLDGGAGAEDDEPTVPIDLRLVVPAACWWAGSLVAIWGSGQLAAAVAATAALGAVAALAVLRGRSRRTVVLAFLCLAAASGSVGLRVAADRTSDAYEAALDHRSALVEFVVQSAPVPVSSRNGLSGNRFVVGGELGTVRLAVASVQSDLQITVFCAAQGWRAVRIGERVAARGRLAVDAGGGWPALTLTAEGDPAVLQAPPWWDAAADDLRASFVDRAAAIAAGDAGALLPGIVLGDRSRLPPALIEDAKITGLTHLLAVSGSHVALLIGVLLLPFRRAGPRIAAVAGVLLIAGLVVLVGPSPSVLRAAGMGTVALLALWFGRVRSLLPALAATVVAALLLDPSLAAEPGFALSVLATAAIVVVVPVWTGALRRRGWPVAWAALLVVPTAAHLATAPVISALSGTVSVWAIPANILVAPAVPVVLMVGMLAVVLAWWPAAVDAALHVAGPFADWIAFCAHWVASWPAATIPWPSTPVGVIGLAVLSIAVPAALRIRRVRVLIVAAGAAVAAILVPAHALSPGWPPAGWLAVGCDVGQGDGFAVSTGTPGEAVVIDTGSDGSVMDRCLDRLDVTGVALLVLTHLHADHIGGLRGVLDRGGVQLVGLGPGRDPPTAWGDVLDAADDARIPVTALPAGTVLGIGDLVVTVLGPDRSRVPAALGPNDQSVVLVIETHGLRMLFAGDVEEAAQRALLRSGQRLDADVLKLPHHGSAKVLPDFLAAVHASVVMIGVGAENEFGHPTAYALELAHQSGAQVILRTDLEGDIAATFTDGVLGTQWRGATTVRGRRRRLASNACR